MVSELIDKDNGEWNLSLIEEWLSPEEIANRPSMTKVLEMLEIELEFLEMPPRSFLFSLEMSTKDHSSKNSMDEPTTSKSV
ncbi:hypothetical protein DITRI_Ditri07aG0095800 [Diplodiscus trichospermus]